MKKRECPAKNDSGFSFIELLVTVTVLSVVVLPLITLLVGGYATMVMAGRQTVAANLCREQIENIKAEGYNEYYSLVEEEPDGVYRLTEDPVPGFSFFRRETAVWLEIEEPDPGFLINVLVIRVKVSWMHREAERSVEVYSKLAHR